jgi:type VI secretion system FHA domain protein
MPLILTLTDRSGRGLRDRKTLVRGSLSIGRASGNDWVLEDPDRHLSKTHCMVSAESGRWVLTDMSTNGVFINGAAQPTVRDSRTFLTDGDEFRLGEYVITVSEAAAQAAMPTAAADPFDLGFSPAPPPPAPFQQAGFFPGARSDIPDPLGYDPLDDSFGSPAPAANPFPYPMPSPPPSLRSQDPFDLADSSRNTNSDPDDLFSPRAPLDNWKGASQPDNVDAPKQAFVAPKAIVPRNLADLDIDALLGDTPPPGVAAPSPAPWPGTSKPQARADSIDDFLNDSIFGQASPAPATQPAVPLPFPTVRKDSIDDLLGDPAPAKRAPTVPPQATPAPPPIPASPRPTAAAKDPLDDLLGDSLFGQAAPAPVAEPAAALPLSPKIARDSLDDLLGDAPSRPAPPPAAPARDALDDFLGGASPFAEPPPSPTIQPPAMVRPPEPPPAVAPAARTVPPRPAAAPADTAALLARFLQGAGVPDLPLGGQDPEAIMQAAGEVFRVLVEGLRDVLMSRAAIKNELRVEQTVLRARNNNALKFSVTPEEAVGALLVPNKPGYKPPLDAAREGFDDLKSHELAVMAGVQTALMGLLKRFDPAALETRLQPGRLDSIMPAARKARFWELFCTTYKDIAREAEDDFQSVFGREFARAYDAQTRKL